MLLIICPSPAIPPLPQQHLACRPLPPYCGRSWTCIYMRNIGSGEVGREFLLINWKYYFLSSRHIAVSFNTSSINDNVFSAIDRESPTIAFSCTVGAGGMTWGGTSYWYHFINLTSSAKKKSVSLYLTATEAVASTGFERENRCKTFPLAWVVVSVKEEREMLMLFM